MALVDAGVLHLHRDLAAVGHHGPVHLADRRRRDRHGVPVEEDAARGRRRARRGPPPRPGSGAIGGTSACSVASAACASGGRPSAMKPISWPAFMMAPFMLPSSRATSSAVRMANCSSSGRSASSSARGAAHLHHGEVGAASSREPPDPRRSVEAIAAVCVGEGDPTGDRGRDQATSERCCGQPSRHRARRSQLAEVAQRTANGAACNRSSPIGPPQTSHVS